jgi:signal transduction histidine kinase
MGINDNQAILAQMLPAIATQMRAALGNIHLASGAIAPADAREDDAQLDAKAAMLDQAYYRLLRLVDNLTAMSLCCSAAKPAPAQDRDLVDLVGQICEKCSSLAELLELNFSFSCPEKSHVCAVYRDSMEQLVFQLLSNAFKFTPSGGSVSVELKFIGGQVILSVTDTGCGISEELMPTLFDRYLHRDLINPPPHGLGLGLPLCRRIAEGHGGSIVAESRKGEGTRIVVSIPDRITGNLPISDVRFDYAGGFNQTLLELADALPKKAFQLRNQG